MDNTTFEYDPAYINIRDTRVYLTSPYMAEERGLRIIRNGLLLGELKKNRFEPSQAFAMALTRNQFNNCLDLPVSDDRVIRYLKERLSILMILMSNLAGHLYVLMAIHLDGARTLTDS